MSRKRRLSAMDAFLLQLEQQKNCDVTFAIEGKNIGAHKSFLEARSDVFQEMFENWNPEKGPIVIEDLSYDIFQQTLRYLYSDEITVTNNNVFHFFYAAQHFQLDRLEACCSKFISEYYLDVTNTCAFMKEAINFEAADLKKACLKMFSCDTEEVLMFISDLSQPALSALLDIEYSFILEIDLFLGVKEWIVEQCLRQKIPLNGTNMRKVLGDALYKIRFPTMSLFDFSNNVATIEGFLDDTEVAQIYKKITICDNDNITCAFSDTFRCVNSLINLCDDDASETHLSLSTQKLISRENKRCTLIQYVNDWHTHNSSTLDKTLMQIILQCCADLTNCSTKKPLVSGFINPTRKENFKTILSQWIECNKSETRTAMDQFFEIRKALATLPERQ